MEIYSKIPQQDEFVKVVNNFNFSEEEINSQKQFVAKYSNMNWDTYLNKVYLLFTNYFNLSTFVQEFEKFNGNQNSKSYSIPNLISKHIRPELEEELKLVNDLLEKLNDQQKIKYNSFINKLLMLLMIKLIENISDNSINIEKLSGQLVNIKTQILEINPIAAANIQKVKDLTEEIYLPNFRSVLQKYNELYFYFPDKTPFFDQLHDMLVSAEAMNAHPNFKELFKTEFAYAEVGPIIWNHNFTDVQSYYLLYCLNNKKYTFSDMHITAIANRLFQYKKIKNQNSMLNNYRKAVKKFEDKDYLYKKIRPISEIIYKLGI